MTKLPCRQGCGQQVRRGQMESHIDTECTFLVVCPQGCPAALPRFQFKQHIATCPNVSVPCSRGCQTQVPRCFLASHLELQCLVALPCPQSCGLALPQKDFGTHAAMCVEVSVPCMAWEFECAFVGPRRLLADHERACAVVVLLPALKRMCGVVNSQRTLIEGLTQEQAASQKRIESLAQEKVAANKLIDGLIEEQAALAKRLAALTQQQELYRAESEAQFKFQHVRIQQMEENISSELVESEQQISEAKEDPDLHELAVVTPCVRRLRALPKRKPRLYYFNNYASRLLSLI